MLTENNLYPYQKAVVDFIIKKPFCGVFLDMGLGKTVSTLTAVNYLMNDYLEVNSVLIIAPKRVVESVWQEESEKWQHLRHLRFSKVIGNVKQRMKALFENKADIYIISRDNVSWLCSLFCSGRLPFDMVIVDELSSFKSNKAVRFKALQACRPYFKRFVGLTGTPAPNSLMDLWSQMYLIDRGERLEKTITNYRSKYFRPGHSNGHVVYSYVAINGSDKIIYDKIKDVCISMNAQDYITLPDKHDNFIKLKPDAVLLKKYKAFEKEKILELYNSMSGQLDKISAVNAAGLSNKLLQFANGAVYNEDSNVAPIHDIKLDALEEIVENVNGQSVLIAWTYKFDRDRIMQRLSRYGPRELKTRADINDWNNGRVQVMLAHPASAGHGLNLQAGGHIIVWYGLTWSLELYQQFNARLCRQGQLKPVIINHLILKGTIDDDVISALNSKDKCQNALLQNIKLRISKYFNYE